ncbi:MAG: ParB/RepB/Spo0J family partition protein [Oscillospiraceae bacterium]|nr:ParB/RepB/Spo0J family partition protein [Oscillospiraceae bacterium]
MPKKGLGKGLDSLFSDDDIEEVTSDINYSKEGDITNIRLSLIEPNKKQPRRNFDEEKIAALADSIKENGLIQPIIITPSENGLYKIVAGERRWRAAKKAKLKEIPAIVRTYNDEQVAEIALIENLQRENLNPIEEAVGYNLLMEEFNLTQELISRRVGKSRSAVANSLRLLSLEDDIKKTLINGSLSSGHARAVLSLDNAEMRAALAKRIIDDNLNVRQAEALAKQLQRKAPPKKQKEKTAYDIEIESLQNKLSSAMGTKVRINHGPKKGKIEIDYYGNDDLERILEFFNVKGE